MRLLLRKYLFRSALLLTAAALCGCMKWEYGQPEEFDRDTAHALFIVNEGNFQYGNASLSCYDPAAKQIENEVFFRANGYKLGDTGQSMTVHNGIGWVVVNHSHIIFAIDLRTFREVGRIEGFTSPRYIHFVSDSKAYVTQLWDNRICIVDPQRFAITGYIECPRMTMATGSTEQMAAYGDDLFVSCWSYQNRLLRIDTRTDRISGELEVGIQPASIAVDRNGKLWALTDGGYAGSPYGHEAPALLRIDAATFRIEQRFGFREGDEPSELCLNGAGDRIYWINGAVWSMAADSESLPEQPLIPARQGRYYGLTVDPQSGEVYVADAIDYQQPGTVYRHAPDGTPIDAFQVGVNPGSFCWK